MELLDLQWVKRATKMGWSSLSALQKVSPEESTLTDITTAASSGALEGQPIHYGSPVLEVSLIAALIE